MRLKHRVQQVVCMIEFEAIELLCVFRVKYNHEPNTTQRTQKGSDSMRIIFGE